MRVLIDSYAAAIRTSMIFALATVGLAFIVTFGMESRTINASKKKDHDAEQGAKPEKGV
jgi:hypothetical protein